MSGSSIPQQYVLELCCFEWFQNKEPVEAGIGGVLELCCFEWFQNRHKHKQYRR